MTDHGPSLPPGAAIHAGDRDALDVAVAWASTEGWRPGRHDALAYAMVDPDGLLSVRQDGAVVTTLVAARYDAGFGFVGLYITDPAYRGRGLGRALFATGLAHLAGVTSVGLDGVVEREDLYASLGFRRAHLSRRWMTTEPIPAGSGQRTIDARDIGAGALGEYERASRTFPAPREAFLQAWLALPESAARAVVGDDGEVRGYGVVRRCDTGARIGPLFADDPGTAEILLDDLLARGAEWGPVSIDIPDPNETGIALARDRGMAAGFACVRMYAGTDPGLTLSRVFGLTSFELG